MANVSLRIDLGDSHVQIDEIKESNTDRLGPSQQYGAPIDFDRLAEPLASLLACAVRRACAAVDVPVGEVIDLLARSPR